MLNNNNSQFQLVQCARLKMDLNSVFINDPQQSVTQFGCDRPKTEIVTIGGKLRHCTDAVGRQACLDVDVGTACKKVV